MNALLGLLCALAICGGAPSTAVEVTPTPPPPLSSSASVFEPLAGEKSALAIYESFGRRRATSEFF
jgi:hypothetical protein